MKRILQVTTGLALAGFSTTGYSQIDPTINGNQILCPGQTITLSTENTYDSYQWLRRELGETAITPIAGETSSTIEVDADTYSLAYLSVRVTSGAEADTSIEALIDSYVFLLPSVSSTGEYAAGGNGEFVICPGDTMYFTMNMPYSENITWFAGGTAIAGETATMLTVTEPGIYTVEGAPEACPDYIQPLGLNLDVIQGNCGLGLSEETLSKAVLYPNPAAGIITVESDEQIFEVNISTAAGKRVTTDKPSATIKSFDTSGLAPGIYFMTINYGNSSETQQFTVN